MGNRKKHAKGDRPKKAPQEKPIRLELSGEQARELSKRLWPLFWMYGALCLYAVQAAILKITGTEAVPAVWNAALGSVLLWASRVCPRFGRASVIFFCCAGISLLELLFSGMTVLTLVLACAGLAASLAGTFLELDALREAARGDELSEKWRRLRFWAVAANACSAGLSILYPVVNALLLHTDLDPAAPLDMAVGVQRLGAYLGVGILSFLCTAAAAAADILILVYLVRTARLLKRFAEQCEKREEKKRRRENA